MATYLMAAKIGGTRNGEEWPDLGSPAPADLSEVEQRDMLANGQITESSTVLGRRVARAAAERAKVIAENAALLAEQAAQGAESAQIAAADAERALADAEKIAADARKAADAEVSKVPQAETSTPAAASVSAPSTPANRAK